MKRIIVKNSSGATIYYADSISDANRYIIQHEVQGLTGLTMEIEDFER